MDADERFRKASRDEQRIDTRENSSLDEMAKGLRPLFEPELPLAGQLIAALRISALKKAASGSGYEAASATRVLERLSVQTSFYIPRDFERQKHFDRAALALEIATEIHPERPRGWIDLAANRARLGRKSLAVAALERAISAGYTDAAALRSDERFADLRETPEFSRVLEKMRSR